MATRRPGRSDAAIIIATLIASLLLHLVLWPIGNRIVTLARGDGPIEVGGGFMEVTLVPRDREDAEPPREQESEPDTTDPQGKLVNLDAIQDERRPEDAEHLAEFDNTVEQETRTRNRDPDEARPPGPRGRESDTTPAPPRPRARTAQEPNEPRERTTPSAGQEAPQGLDLDQAVLAELARGERSDASAERRGERPSGEVGSRVPDFRRLPPAARERLAGGAGSIDPIDDDVPLGPSQQLNSHRWKYASFFNRVRNQVAQHWKPEVVHAARDPHGNVFGTKTRRTILVITLNRDGSLARVRLDAGGDSGARHLDEEAIRAVRAAAPFTNPPPQLVARDTGLIEFRFGFIFEIGRRRNIFRMR